MAAQGKSPPQGEQAKQPRRKMSVAEYGKLLMDRVHKELANGLSADKAIEKALTPSQYDWLVDHDFDLDSILLSKEQLDNAKTVVKQAHTRRLSPEGYNKKYPKEKQALYELIKNAIEENGGTVTCPEKANYRDMAIEWQGGKYKIVLSQPRK